MKKFFIVVLILMSFLVSACESNQVLIGIGAELAEGGIVLNAKTGNYKKGTELFLEAQANDGYVHIGWALNHIIVSLEPTFTHKVERKAAIQAVFLYTPRTLIVYDASLDFSFTPTSITNIAWHLEHIEIKMHVESNLDQNNEHVILLLPPRDESYLIVHDQETKSVTSNIFQEPIVIDTIYYLEHSIAIQTFGSLQRYSIDTGNPRDGTTSLGGGRLYLEIQETTEPTTVELILIQFNNMKLTLKLTYEFQLIP